MIYVIQHARRQTADFEIVLARGGHLSNRNSYVGASLSVKHLFSDRRLYLKGLGVNVTIVLKRKQSMMNMFPVLAT